MPGLYQQQPVLQIPAHWIAQYALQTFFYLPSTGAATVSPAFDAGWEETSNADRLKMVTTSISSSLTDKTVTSVLSSGQALFRQYVSDPLQAQTFNTRVVIYARALETLGSLNGFSNVVLKVVTNDGSSVRGTLFALGDYSSGAEWATALTNKGFVNGRFPTSVTAQAGDRLVLEIGLSHDALITTATINFGDNAAGFLPEDETTTTALNPFMGLGQTVLFQTGTAYSIQVGGSITPTAVNVYALTAQRVGASTPSGSTIHAVSAVRSGASTPAGSVLGAIAVSRSGGVSPSGATTRAISATRTGVMMPSGLGRDAISSIITGQATPGGVEQGTLGTLASGVIAPAGALQESLGKILTGAVAPAGAVQQVLSVIRVGALVPIGSQRGLVSLVLTGATTPSGVDQLTALLAITGAITPGGQDRFTLLAHRSGALTPTGLPRQAIFITRSGQVVPAGALIATILQIVVLCPPLRLVVPTLALSMLGVPVQAQAALLVPTTVLTTLISVSPESGLTVVDSGVSTLGIPECEEP